MKWIPEDYDGVKIISMWSGHIWRPDIVLANRSVEHKQCMGAVHHLCWYTCMHVIYDRQTDNFYVVVHTRMDEQTYIMNLFVMHVCLYVCIQTVAIVSDK